LVETSAALSVKQSSIASNRAHRHRQAPHGWHFKRRPSSATPAVGAIGTTIVAIVIQEIFARAA
jgi:hypothetical protein